jgi:ABC-type multidrug transport system fused ATPase/permease subunit
VHTERRAHEEIAIERLNELWAQSQQELFGDSVRITDGYRPGWSYVHHFTGSPGYVHAYAYGQLLALSIFRRYLETGDSFVPDYLDLLRAGGSMPPEDLFRIVGMDLTDGGGRRRRLALMLKVSDIEHSVDAEPLFGDVSFVLNDGERVGLVGPNGVGKTTLLEDHRRGDRTRQGICPARWHGQGRVLAPGGGRAARSGRRVHAEVAGRGEPP